MEQEMKLLPLREADGRFVVAEPNLSMFEFFLAVMKNVEAHEPVLSIIMNDRELKLVEVKVEEVILNESGRRGIRLDAWAIDSKDRQRSGIEECRCVKRCQQELQSNSWKRMRGHPLL